MYSDDLGGCLAHRTAADEWPDAVALHWHHGDSLGCGQPEGLIVTLGVVAHLIEVTEDVGHGAESGQTGPSLAWYDSNERTHVEQCYSGISLPCFTQT